MSELGLVAAAGAAYNNVAQAPKCTAAVAHREIVADAVVAEVPRAAQNRSRNVPDSRPLGVALADHNRLEEEEGRLLSVLLGNMAVGHRLEADTPSLEDVEEEQIVAAEAAGTGRKRKWAAEASPVGNSRPALVENIGAGADCSECWTGQQLLAQAVVAAAAAAVALASRLAQP